MLPGRILSLTIAIAAALLLNTLQAFAQTNASVAETYNKAITAIQNKDYKTAQVEARKLINSERWKKGDVLVAGSIRGIANGLVANKQVDLAQNVLTEGETATQPTGTVALAFKGLVLPRTATKSIGAPAAIAADKPFDPARDLKRIRAGNQCSVLKVMSYDNKSPLYTKWILNGPALDGVLWAPIYDEHRAGIFKSLGIKPDALDFTTNLILSSSQKGISKEGLALLGVLASAPGDALSPATRTRLEEFLLMAMFKSKSPINKRQALLALALSSQVSEKAVNEVVRFYGSSYNPYEVFPVSQFFEYHSKFVKGLSSHSTIKDRIAKVDSFYTPQILNFL
jgi:hypothetical protein